MARSNAGGELAQGGARATVPCGVTWVFAWKGAVGASALTVASLATAWSTTATVRVGQVLKSSDGRAIGCVVAGVTAASGTGPASTDFATSTTKTTAAGSGSSLPSVTDGTATWILLSGPLVVIGMAVYNWHATAYVTGPASDSGVLAGTTGTAGTGPILAPLPGGQAVDGATPEALYVISDTASTPVSVVVYA